MTPNAVEVSKSAALFAVACGFGPIKEASCSLVF